mgnify:CR=1 FL=1
MHAPQHSASEVDAVFEKLDADKSGGIDTHELKQYFKMANGVGARYGLLAWFAWLRDGELLHCFTAMPPIVLQEGSLARRKTAAEIMKFFDTNGDGIIDKDEFRDGMEKLMRGSIERKRTAEELISFFHDDDGSWTLPCLGCLGCFSAF